MILKKLELIYQYKTNYIIIIILVPFIFIFIGIFGFNTNFICKKKRYKFLKNGMKTNYIFFT